VVESGAEARVAHALVGALNGQDFAPWDDLVLANMDAGSTFVVCLQKALEATGMQVETESPGACPYVALPSTFDAYVRMLEPRSRYHVNRALRELDKWAGKDGWTLHRARTPAELEEGRRVLHELHHARWALQGQDGVFARDRFRQFHDEVMPELLRGVDGALDLLWLTVGGRPVAVVYNIVYANKVFMYQCGRTDDVPKGLRIGTAMNLLAIRDAIEKGRSEYDFLNGNVQYKRQLSVGQSRQLVTLRAVSTSARARALDATRKTADGLIARARTLKTAIVDAGHGAKAPTEETTDDPAA
jgi:CelD/BcsL family acetyltransferase involved in cellulose biosynthesis